MASSDHKIGALAALSYTIGNMIGSGIFISPTSVLKESGSVGSSLLVWGVCGVLSLLGSLAYIELATSIQRSGADLAYVQYVGWMPIASAFVWINIVALPCSAAIIADAFGEYCLKSWETIHGQDKCLAEYTTKWAKKFIGFCLICALAALNQYSLKRITAPFQIAASASKIVATTLVIFIGFYYLLFRGWTESFQSMLVGTSWAPGGLVLAIYAGLWAFSGWEILNFGTEEIKNPKRTFPVASFGGTMFVTIVYLAINVSYFTVLNREEMLESDAVAATFSNRVISFAPMVVPILIAVTMIGTLNTNFFMSTRYYFAAARSGFMPRAFGLLSPLHGSPRPAVILYACLTICVSFVGDLNDFINVYTFCMSCQRVFTLAALIKIRVDNIPVHDEAFRMPFVLLMFFICFCSLLIIVPVYQMPKLCVIGAGILLCSFLVYYLRQRFEKRMPQLTKLDWQFANFCQKLLMVVYPEPISHRRFTRRLSHNLGRPRVPHALMQRRASRS